MEVKIPQPKYGLATDAPGVRLSPGATGGYDALARGADRLANVIAGWGQEEMQAARATEFSRAQLAALKETNEAILKLERDPDWQKGPDNYSTAVREIRDRHMASLTDTTVRERFKNDFEKHAETAGITLRRKLLETGEKQATAALEETLDTEARAAATAPNELARNEAMERGIAAINRWRGAGTDEHGALVKTTAWGNDLEAARRSRGFRNRVDGDRALGMIQSDPETAVTALADPGQFQTLSEEQRLRLQARADGRVNALMAERRGVVSRRLEDEVASIRETGSGIGVTPLEIRKAYAPDDATRIEQQLETERRFYTARSTVAFNTPEQDQALLNQQTPKGEGYAAQAQRRDLVAQAIHSKRELLFGRAGQPNSADPVGYVLQASPEIRVIMAEAAQHPESLPAALGALDEAQARLGVRPEDRRVMSSASAAESAQRLAGLPGEQAADAMQQLAGQYGDRWPAAWGDLVRAGKLPGGYRVLATVTDPVGRKALAETLKTPMAELKKAAGPESEPIDKGLDDALAEFSKTLAFVPDRETVYNDVRDAVQRLAYRYSGSASGDEALQRAAAQVINSRYEFSGHARLPKGQRAPVEDTAERTLGALKPADLRAYPGDADGKATLSAARRGIWVTAPDDAGWIRLDVNRQPVLRADGSVLGFRFRDATTTPPDEFTVGPEFVPVP